MECGIFINVHIFTHPALSLEREVDRVKHVRLSARGNTNLNENNTTAS
jgi:hypothetical protein